MNDSTQTLRDAYRASIVRTRAANAILEGSVADLACCMRVEMEAGRAFMALMESRRATGVCRWRRRRGAHWPARGAAPKGEERIP